jgi:hypothetical protein
LAALLPTTRNSSVPSPGPSGVYVRPFVGPITWVYSTLSLDNEKRKYYDGGMPNSHGHSSFIEQRIDGWWIVEMEQGRRSRTGPFDCRFKCYRKKVERDTTFQRKMALFNAMWKARASGAYPFDQSPLNEKRTA